MLGYDPTGESNVSCAFIGFLFSDLYMMKTNGRSIAFAGFSVVFFIASFLITTRIYRGKDLYNINGERRTIMHA